MSSFYSKFVFSFTIVFLLLSLGTSSIVRPPPAPTNPCTQIQQTFAGVAKPDERPICECIMNTAPRAIGPNGTSPSPASSDFWIGCTRHKMTALFRALQALDNRTRVPHLHIWDALLNILPNDPKPMFSQIHADRLTIERSRVAVIRQGAFANVGPTLRRLSLRNNILKSVGGGALAGLGELRHLDLGGNKLTELGPAAQWGATVPQLEELILAENQLGRLEDGQFAGMPGLRVLDLARNNLKRITKDTFKGLSNLEELNLSGNKLESIDRDAFTPLKALRVLLLGYNNLTRLQLHGNAALERLMLNNNSIRSVADCKFVGLTALHSLLLSNNNITTIGDSDLRALAQSPELASLALDGNQISRVGCRAFAPVSDLAVLSLQHNHISSLSCSASPDPISFTVYLDQSFLHPLHKLRRLLLSHNAIRQIGEDDLIGLPALRELSLDNNQISRITHNAFLGTRQLQKLFLNDNHLYYLPQRVFDALDMSRLRALDLSDNPWECICGEEWLGAWLAAEGTNASSPSGNMGCLVESECSEQSAAKSAAESDEENAGEGYYDPWIRLVACVLALVSILFLVIAGYVYMQESHRHYSVLALQRASSDTVRLIPSVESLLSVPNPILAEMGPPNRKSPGGPAPIAINVRARTGEPAEGEKKRVRFQ